MLRDCSHWAFIQKNIFTNQGSNSKKVFTFKMSEVELGSGVDSVKQMKLGGDL